MSKVPQKKWANMTPGEKKKARARIEKAVIQSKKNFANSQSQRIARVLSDGSTPGKKKQLDPVAMDAAIWCLTHRGKLLPEHYVTAYYTHDVIANLRDGDSAFFQNLADTMKSLEDEGFSLNADGTVTSRPVAATARLLIAQYWDEWEFKHEKIEVRLAILKEKGCPITKSRYYGIIEQDGLRST